MNSYIGLPNAPNPGGSLYMEWYMVKQYRIKGAGEQYLKVVRETSEGVSVVITRIDSGWKEEMKDFMPRSLFETCLRTDYLTPLTL